MCAIVTDARSSFPLHLLVKAQEIVNKKFHVEDVALAIVGTHFPFQHYLTVCLLLFVDEDSTVTYYFISGGFPDAVVLPKRPEAARGSEVDATEPDVSEHWSITNNSSSRNSKN